MVSGAYPQVQAFIKSDRPERYKGLTIKYVRGADPVIKLLDDEEDVSNKKNVFVISWSATLHVSAVTVVG